MQEQALERAELNLRSARGFFEVGTRPKSDVARAEVDVANARVDLIRARNAERLARVALNTAMGIAVDTPTAGPGQPRLPDDAARPARSFGPRRCASGPEYRQARLRVDAAEARVRRAFRDFFPDVTGDAAPTVATRSRSQRGRGTIGAGADLVRSSTAATGSPATARRRRSWTPPRPA